MRWLLTFVVLPLLLVGCFHVDDDDGGVPVCVWQGVGYPLGAVFPAGDGCNSCQCQSDGVACTLVACEDLVDAAPPTCRPVPGVCAVGPVCGDVCCDTGEQCVDGACQCGAGPACPSGDSCEAAGPVGEDGCGAICCGASGPCPL